MQIDVIDLCALLECIGLKIQSVDSVEPAPPSDVDGGNTVTVVCKHSGLRVVMDSTSTVCTCPAAKPNDHASGFWQVSGVSNGVVENNRETGSSLLGKLPENTKNIMRKELHKIIQYSRTHANEDETANPRPALRRSSIIEEFHVKNKSTSLTELNLSPLGDDRNQNVKNSPPRYGSLDALTARLSLGGLPAPGQLVPKIPGSDTSEVTEDGAEKPKMVRQETYTRPSPDKSSVITFNRTSSPITKLSTNVVAGLMVAERSAEELRDRLAKLVQVMSGGDGDDDCASNLSLDVSKITLNKEPQSKFVSSPNLASAQMRRGNSSSGLRKPTSVSKSQIMLRQKTPTSIRAPSKLSKWSPGAFRKSDEETKTNGVGEGVYRKVSEKSSKIAAPARSRISMGVAATRTPTNTKPEQATSLSTTKKKMYNHIRSTIPKPSASATKKE